MINKLTNETQLIFTLITALGAALTIDEAWIKVLTAVAALLLGLLVRQTVSSPATVVDAVTQAATDTARDLSTKTVGAVGSVGTGATTVIKDVVTDVIDNVGGLVPRLTKGK